MRMANVALLLLVVMGGAKPAAVANGGGESARIGSTTVAYVRGRGLDLQRHRHAGFRHIRGCNIAAHQ